MTPTSNRDPEAPAAAAVIFDLDGVLTDTAELHFQSWKLVADQLNLPFQRRAYDRMRGLGREQSLDVLLEGQPHRFTSDQKRKIADRKNDAYLQRVAQMTPASLAPGALELLEDLRRHDARLAIASSSRNAQPVVERLGVAHLFDVVLDANQVPHSKPDPRVFRAAAERLGVPANRCVVIEDARVGVAAAHAARMLVIGIGPPDRVGDAHLVVDSLARLDAERVLNLLPR